MLFALKMILLGSKAQAPYQFDTHKNLLLKTHHNVANRANIITPSVLKSRYAQITVFLSELLAYIGSLTSWMLDERLVKVDVLWNTMCICKTKDIRLGIR